MAALISTLFFAFLCALFYSVGLSLRGVLKGLEWENSIIVTSACGLALAALGVTLGYRFGLRPQLLFWLLTCFGTFCFAHAWIRRRSQIGTILRTAKSYVLIGVLAAGLMLAPIWTGGIGFALFQGNHIDALRYLESALTYTKWPYAQVHGATPQQLLNAGLFPVAAQILNIRPTVAILYAVVSNFAPSLFLGLNYVMLVYFQFLSLGVLWLVSRELVPGKPLSTLILCFLITGGFWGQYILDINAWSQEAVLPLLLMIVLVLLRSFSHQRDGKARSMFWSPTVFALIMMGAFYFYPEATMFYLPGIAVALCLGFWKTRKAVKMREENPVPLSDAESAGLKKSSSRTVGELIGTLIPPAAGALILLLAVKENNVDFLRVQAGVAVQDVDWWKYFDICFLGRDGISATPGADLIDAGTSVLGGYMLTPGPGAPGSLALIWRGALGGVLMLVIVNFLRRLKYLSSPGREMLCSAVGVFVSQTAILLLLHQYWTAGKALSFFAFLLLLVVFCPLVMARWQDWSGAACWVLLGVQGWMLIYRPIAAKKRAFGHYLEPYPAALDRNLKKRFDFSDWSVLKEIKAGDKIRIEVEDPWLQYFAQMLLLSHNRRFCVACPVDESGIPFVASPCGPGSADFTCRLSLVVVWHPSVREHLKIERLANER